MILGLVKLFLLLTDSTVYLKSASTENGSVFFNLTNTFKILVISTCWFQQIDELSSLKEFIIYLILDKEE